MRTSSTRVRGAAGLVVALLAVSCASPPNKEMDQAQGGIDAARAAGAERFAATEYAAATDALTRANEAVAARDYRLALNHALESRERAQDAARIAAETRATLRGTVERSRAEVAALLAQAKTRLADAAPAQISRRARRTAGQTLTQVEADLQEADEALLEEDYTGAQRVLTGVKERIQAVLATISGRPIAQSPRPRG